MASYLLIWDTNKSFSDAIRNELQISDSDNITSLEQLKNKEKLSTIEVAIVLLETDLNNKRRSELYGLEFIKILRKERRYKGLIIVYSTYPAKFLKAKNGTEILFTSATRLKALSGKIDFNEIGALAVEVPQLSDDLLDDISYSIFDYKGKIHELLHNLKNDLHINNHTGTLEKVKDKITGIFEIYKKQLQSQVDQDNLVILNQKLNSLFRELSDDVNENWDRLKKQNNNTAFSYYDAGTHISKYSLQIAQLAPVSSDNTVEHNKEDIEWEVLFLDDKEVVSEIVKSFFRQKNVVCHLATNEQEVYNKLKDCKSKISLFISDIRLIDEAGCWYDKQGYDIIEEVNQKNEYPLVYSVLTSKKGTINKLVQQKRKYEILWFTKDDVINNIHSFNIYFDLVRKYAEENFYSNSLFQPEYSIWNNPQTNQKIPLKIYYKHHKVRTDYDRAEATINEKVINYLNEVTPIPTGWTSKLDKQGIDDDELEKFRNIKLLGRRLVLGIAAMNRGIKPEKIYTKMTGEEKTRVNEFFSMLALPKNPQPLIENLRDYCNGIKVKPGVLYEEYKFLKSEFFDEELFDEYRLAHEHEILENFIEQITTAFIEHEISEPVSLKRVRLILENKGVPKLERLRTMFRDVEAANQQTKYKLLQKVVRNKTFEKLKNEEIVRLLNKFEWV